MKIPDQIKIGGIVYKIIMANEWFEHEDANGETFSDVVNGNTIYIRDTLTQEVKEETLIHEILHGCNSTMDHEFLDSLAGQIYQVFKDANFFS